MLKIFSQQTCGQRRGYYLATLKYGNIAKELYDARDKPERWSNPVTLPVVDAGFIHPDLLRDLLLEQSQVKALGSEMVTIGPQGGRICLRFRFLG